MKILGIVGSCRRLGNTEILVKEALMGAQELGADVPTRIDVVSIEAKMTYDFSEDLSPEIAAAVPVAGQG